MERKYLGCWLYSTWLKIYVTGEIVYIFARQIVMILVLYDQITMASEEDTKELKRLMWTDRDFRIINGIVPAFAMFSCSLVFVAEKNKRYGLFTPWLIYLSLRFSLSLSSCLRQVFPYWDFPMTEATLTIALTNVAYYLIGLVISLTRRNEMVRLVKSRYASISALV